VIEILENHLNFKFSKKYFAFWQNVTSKKKPFSMCQYHPMDSHFHGLQFVRASPTSCPAGPLEKLKSKFICNHIAICIIYWFIHSIRSCFVSCIVSFNQSHHHSFMSWKLVTFHILVGSKMPDLEHPCMIICGKCQGIKTSHNITKRVCFWEKACKPKSQQS